MTNPNVRLDLEALKRFPDDTTDVQSRIILVHQLRVGADILDKESTRLVGRPATSDRAVRSRKAADAIEDLIAHIERLEAGMREMDAAATLVTEWLDRINDRDGTALGGPQWFGLGRAIHKARATLSQGTSNE